MTASGLISGEAPEVISVVSPSESVGPGATSSARVLCPSGMVALGGGVDASNVLTMTVMQTAPAFGDEPTDNLFSQPSDVIAAPVGWEATMLNEDSTTLSFKVAAICGKDTSLGTFVGDATVPGLSTNGLQLECPDGTICTSGGIEPEDTSLMPVDHVTPLLGESGDQIFFLPDGEHDAPGFWSGAVHNPLSPEQSVKVAAVFTRMLGSLTTVVSSGTAPADSFDAERVLCPPGTAAVGGGVDPNASDQVRLTSSGPAYGDTNDVSDRLLGRSEGLNPGPVGWQISVRNETSFPRDFKAAAVCSRRALGFFISSVPEPLPGAGSLAR